MDQRIDNHPEIGFVGKYIGGNEINNNYFSMYNESEREFVVTHNANIKPTTYFTGRETELQELRQRIEEGRKSVLVSGMGGIGKTHICRKLFEEYSARNGKGKNGLFKHIGYIEYDSDMNSSLQNCLKFRKQEQQEDNQEAAWRELEYLASGGKLLLFVDNVNVAISEDVGLRRLKSIPGAVVLTSRRTSLSKEFEPYRIGFLSTEQCKKIYERIRYDGSDMKVPAEEVADLEYVINKLAAGHTITIEFLAHLAMTKHWNVERLRKELDQNGFCLEYRDEEDKLVNIQKSYETLYSLSGLSLAEQNILEAFSVFPYFPLSADVCNQWLLPDAGVGEDADILTGLYRKGWLQYDMKQESYTMHPVFAQFIYEKYKPSIKKHHGLIEACQKSLEIPESGSALECQQYIPFAENIVKKVDMKNSIEQIEFIDVIAHILNYIARYDEARMFYERLAEVCQILLGEEHSATIASYSNLAGTYKEQGKYREAKELYNKTLYVCKDVLGEEHLDTITVCNNLAQIHEIQGEYMKAKELYEKGLEVRRKVLGEQHLDTATSYNNLGGIYEKLGRYEKAKELCERCLQIRKKVLGDEHPEVALSYGNLAYLYSRQGKYPAAEELFKKTLQIQEKTLGKEHPSVARNYSNLAQVYQNQGKYPKAEELYEMSLQIYKKVFGKEHPSTANGYNRLARVYESKGDYLEAKKLYEISLFICEKVYGKEHLSTAINYGNLAKVCKEQGNYERAKELYDKSLCVHERVLGKEHPSVAPCYNNLAQVYLSQGDYAKAETLFRRSLWICENAFGKEHINVAFVHNNLAYTFEYQAKHKDALDCFFQAYKIYILKFGLHHKCTQEVYNNMRIIYLKMVKGGNFERWFRKKMKENT